MARFFANPDTDDNAMGFGVLCPATPGTAGFLTIPEPTKGLLVGSVLGLLLPFAGKRAKASGRPTASHPLCKE